MTMPPRKLPPIALSLFLLFCWTFISTCGFDDTIFFDGTGNLKGTVLIDGQPIPGAEVNWVGAPFTQAPALSQNDGTFNLTQVPAGKKEIIIRAIDQSHGLRLSVRAVSDQTTQLGPLDLQEAPPLRITVTDPDLPIRDARVYLEEIPGLEGVSDRSGRISLPCVPRTACYTPKVESSNFPFPFQISSCPSKNSEWISGYQIRLIPGPAETQIYHAYQRIFDIVADRSTCTSSCLVPDWWAYPMTPPCALAIPNDQIENYLDGELRVLFQELSVLTRFTNTNTSNKMQCPDQAPITALCVNGRCAFESNHMERAHILSTGSTSQNCSPGILSALESAQELAAAANCVGIASPTWQDDDLFVLFQPNLSLVPTHIELVQAVEERLIIYLQAELSLKAALLADQEEEKEKTRGWALLRIDGNEAGKPKPADVSVHISWIQLVP